MVCCPMTTKIKGYPFEVLTDVDGTKLRFTVQATVGKIELSLFGSARSG